MNRKQSLWDRLGGVTGSDPRLARLRKQQAEELTKWANESRSGAAFDPSTEGRIAFLLDVVEGRRANSRPGFVDKLSALDPADPRLANFPGDLVDLALRLKADRDWTNQEQGRVNAMLDTLTALPLPTSSQGTTTKAARPARASAGTRAGSLAQRESVTPAVTVNRAKLRAVRGSDPRLRRLGDAQREHLVRVVERLNAGERVPKADEITAMQHIETLHRIGIDPCDEPF
jgi:hypothetical protein